MSSVVDNRRGSGSALDPAILRITVVATIVATLVSAASISMHLKNYRKPMLQRMVVRIMLMVPIYAVSSLISLFSLEAAFIIDAIRDIYEAFVIYCFFQLLVGYLGGERSLLIRVHGRQPKATPFPMNVFQRELDVSDPFTFLFLKRGILQYVQVKPFLAIASLALKASGRYNEGEFRADSGYLYVNIIYNASICLSLYCLAMFWLSISEDLKPFRPMPKFLCVKGILFFSFWQATGVSLLVSVGVIKKLGPYTDKEHISLGLTDTLICLEMPFFAIAHLAAFSHRDYINKTWTYVGRMPMGHAFRDAFGFKDVFEDARATLNGQGMDYREFEPSEGHMHQGLGRERRIRAGLRYSHGGRGKYWLPQVAASSRWERCSEGGVNAPRLTEETEDVIQDPGDTADEELVAIGFDLPFGGPDFEDEELYTNSRKYLFGDYNYPCIDASSEVARAEMWEEEERILNNERSAWFSDRFGRNAIAALSYGAVGVSQPQQDQSHTLPPGAVTHSEFAHGPADDHLGRKHRWTSLSKPKIGSRSALVSPPVSAKMNLKGPVARPDAVDIVAEGRHTAEVAVAHVKQQAEYDTLQTHQSLIGNPGGEMEEEVCGWHRVNDPPKVHGYAEEVGTDSELRTTIEVVTRVEPPSHAQMRGLMNVFDDLESNKNPWS
ncbi:organic solute transporter Ostalpha-domain-containing protein [Russula earlei]|uniref:Organic solute transporter Ostalpha-domain-containing protein n=1 Tax=Russula earlei TaxID=71964 RepID=A0ACC0U2M0_9AGAM|nr:organic solute transporter Ostalpha-domain-containing protein [Russula earlei]